MAPVRHSSGKRLSIGFLPSIAVVLALTVILSVLLPTVPQTIVAAVQDGLGATAGARDSIGARLSFSAPPCGILASEYGNLTGINYASNFATIFSQICHTSQFVTSYNEGLSANGPFTIGYGGNTGALPTLSISLYRTETCTNTSFGPIVTQCVFQADWVGYLSNNSFSGPSILQYPLSHSGGGRSPGQGLIILSSLPWLLMAVVGLVVAAIIGVSMVVVKDRRRLRDDALLESATLETSSEQ